MAWYDTGTVNVTNGSTTVVGVGTNFIAGAQVGEGFYGPDNRLYEIQAIVSATALTLADVYLGTTQTGQGYKIVPTQSLVAALATQVSTLISDFQGVVDEAGSGKFDDGTAASAGITFTLDQDTGIFRPAANQIGFTTAGVRRALVSNTGVDVTGNLTVDTSTLHVDSTNNRVGIGTVTPSERLDVGNGVARFSNNITPAVENDGAAYFGKIGNIAAVSGSAGVAFRQSGTELGRINSTGLGIGTSSPSAALDVVGDIKASGNLTAGGLTLDGNSFTNNVIAGTNPTLTFSDTGTNDDWRIRNGDGAFIFENGADGSPTTDRIRIDLDGDISFYDNAAAAKFFWDASTASLGIGTTNPSATLDVVGDAKISGTVEIGSPSDNFPSNDATGSGIALNSNGRISTQVNSNAGLNVGRHTTTGAVAHWYYGGTLVGNVSVTASATTYNTSSDYRLKENITPVQGAADIVKAMQPVTYTFKSDGSWHDGFLAHELQELHPRAVVGEKDAMMDEEYEVTPAVYEDIIIPAVKAVAEVPAVYDDEGVLVSEMIPAVEAQPERTEQKLVSEAVMGTRSVPDYQGVDYSKLTPILTAALQEALNKIDALEARLAALESA